MSFDFFDRRSAERFAELLDETSGSRRHHTRGPADEELAELVAIGHSLSAARSGVQVDSEFRVGLRAMLVATADRDGIGATASDADVETGGGHAAVPQPRGSFFTRGFGRRVRARGAIVIGVAAGAMAVSGISAASENASPGDALYGVKRSTERAQLAMAGSDDTRGQLALDFARTRLAEAASLPGSDSAFGGVLADMDADTRQGVKLLTSSAVARRDVAPLTTVDGFVITQQRIMEPILDRLSAGNRTRAQESLTLLDDVQTRTETLRAGLACNTVASAGVDELGPKLRDCVTGTNGSAPKDEAPQGQGQRVGTKPNPDAGQGTARDQRERTGPTAVPDATGAATAGTTGTTATTTEAPADTDLSTPPAQQVTGEPLVGEPPPEQPAPAEEPGERPLGRLLDGLFGK
ncbi:DUF5667 domain-containing protein [Jidongwangia harbinensis]|uniref:DUF5667 domain-containing protein n=1 Tax=Jidongwangia harbinensis TaxID=2878561 RepID=UPI001CD97117|nr:DUF5667 domain-containing protein [Jidongwangia harbinensis]MCA2213753.1 DUF5667 domain-containing protein [Jidongwangia harbinensis]